MLYVLVGFVRACNEKCGPSVFSCLVPNEHDPVHPDYKVITADVSFSWIDSLCVFLFLEPVSHASLSLSNYGREREPEIPARLPLSQTQPIPSSMELSSGWKIPAHVSRVVSPEVWLAILFLGLQLCYQHKGAGIKLQFSLFILMTELKPHFCLFFASVLTLLTLIFLFSFGFFYFNLLSLTLCVLSSSGEAHPSWFHTHSTSGGLSTHPIPSSPIQTQPTRRLPDAQLQRHQGQQVRGLDRTCI